MQNMIDIDDLRWAWQELGQQMERNQAIQLQLLRETRLAGARRSLRGLYVGLSLQVVLGVLLVLLGIACWSRNPEVPGLLAAGILVHAFGVAHVALGGLTIGLAATIDYSAPVLKIQKQMALLQRFHNFNATACGLPWWVMWLPVVVAFAGLDPQDPAAGTAGWIWLSLGIGVVGLLATWGHRWHAARRPQADDAHSRHDGCDGIRRSRRMLDEIERFERG